MYTLSQDFRLKCLQLFFKTILFKKKILKFSKLKILQAFIINQSSKFGGKIRNDLKEMSGSSCVYVFPKMIKSSNNMTNIKDQYKV